MESYLLVEEGELDPLASLHHKGNLYLLAHGAQAARLLRAIRDQYCGDPFIGSSVDVSLGALDSIEAAAALMSPRQAGISCLAAITNAPNRLSLVGVGDCRAFLEERRKGSPQAILAPRYPHKKLAMEAPGVVERAQRALGPGDRVVLCCGPLAQALGVNELSAVLSTQAEASPQELADQLVSLAEGSGGGAAVVIACREGDQHLVANYLARQAKGLEDSLSAKGLAAPRPSRRKLPLPWLLAAFVVVMFGSAALDALGKYISVPQLSLPWETAIPQLAAGKDLWNQVDDLWARGQKGDPEAWREAVSLLEKLRSIQPGDASVVEKLRAAELNRQYAEAMLQLAVSWGTGETSARTVQSWDKTIEILEGLQAKMGGTGFLKPVMEKLYAARINYGKALEAAGRLGDARATYEKARALDPARPEAADALRKLR